MSSKNLKIGEKFYHHDLNKLIFCRDEHFNFAHDKNDLNKHLKNEFKYFIVDNSGEFHSSEHKLKNTWKEFIVLKSYYGGGGTGMGMHDIYPDAWTVICMPIDAPDVRIKFHQETNCFAHTINEVELIK